MTSKTLYIFFLTAVFFSFTSFVKAAVFNAPRQIPFPRITTATGEPTSAFTARRKAIGTFCKVPPANIRFEASVCRKINRFKMTMTATAKPTSRFIAQVTEFGIYCKALTGLRLFDGEYRPIFPRLPIMTATEKPTRRFIETERGIYGKAPLEFRSVSSVCRTINRSQIF